MGSNFSLSITVLLTGFAVVFAVLLLLIGIIKAYGTVIFHVMNRRQQKKAMRNADLPKIVREPEKKPDVGFETIPEEDDDELIAVISAAVYATYSSSNVRIKSVRRATARSNAWRNAGIADSVRPF